MLIGVLAIQGDFEAHAGMLRGLNTEARRVRVPADLDGLDGLVIPGGESTTISLGIAREGLAQPLRDLIRNGTPVLGTCAGMIMLDRSHLGLLDAHAERNAFGRQRMSFEADIEVKGLGSLRAVFIRAPWIDEVGPGVDVLAELDGRAVAVRQQNILAVAFHPELTDDLRVHEWLVTQVRVQSQREAA